MIAKIAWRNIWRNKVRSLVVIIALALGLWAGTFTSGFYEGMMKQKVDDVIRLEMSHFQLHHPQFREEMLVKYYVDDADRIEKDIREDEHVTGISGRVITTTMMGSPNKNGSAKVIGIDPAEESIVTGLNQKLVEGAYFEGVRRNPILLSQKMAEDYKVKLNSKVVLTMQDVNGEIIAASFRVAGIYKTNNGMFDEVNVFVRRQDLQPLLGLQEDQRHEIAVLLNDHALAEPFAQRYQTAYPDLEVKPWLDLATGMRYMVEASGTFAYVIVIIVLVALLFSVINTMLMAVMERTREIGMLMAVGMNKRKVFLMIMFETLFLAMVGGPIGLLIAFGFIEWKGGSGIDLGAIGEAYSEMGFAAVVYPELGLKSYIDIAMMVFFMALLAAIYPAWKALSLNPSEAIRKI